MEIPTDDFSWIEFTDNQIKERNIYRVLFGLNSYSKQTQEELWLKLYLRFEDGHNKNCGRLSSRKILI